MIRVVFIEVILLLPVVRRVLHRHVSASSCFVRCIQSHFSLSEILLTSALDYVTSYVDVLFRWSVTLLTLFLAARSPELQKGVDVETGRERRGNVACSQQASARRGPVCSFMLSVFCVQWKKHWFVLTDAGLKYYRDSSAEEVGFPLNVGTLLRRRRSEAAVCFCAERRRGRGDRPEVLRQSV